MPSSTREVLRCLLEGVQWLLDPSVGIKVAGKSGISQARSRLGPEPMRRLYASLVGPIAGKRTRGAWYRDWRLVSLDGSSLDVADTEDNEKAFGRPGASRGESAFPKLRFVALLDELKTHLRSAQIVLRSKTPQLVEQEFWGLLLAHFAIRGLMHEAALKADEDPDRLSFLHAVRVVQRRLARYAPIPPSAEESPA
jgi:hypothetical protein